MAQKFVYPWADQEFALADGDRNVLGTLYGWLRDAGVDVKAAQVEPGDFMKKKLDKFLEMTIPGPGGHQFFHMVSNDPGFLNHLLLYYLVAYAINTGWAPLPIHNAQLLENLLQRDRYQMEEEDRLELEAAETKLLVWYDVGSMTPTQSSRMSAMDYAMHQRGRKPGVTIFTSFIEGEYTKIAYQKLLTLLRYGLSTALLCYVTRAQAFFVEGPPTEKGKVTVI